MLMLRPSAPLLQNMESVSTKVRKERMTSSSEWGSCPTKQPLKAVSNLNKDNNATVEASTFTDLC